MNKLVPIMFLATVSQLVLSAEATGPLYSSPLPTLPPDQEVRIDEITMLPGTEAPAHRHDAYVYAYVTEGTIDMQVDNEEVRHVAAGQVFVETPDNVHTMMKNPSATESARFVAFIIKAQDAPVLKFVGGETP